MESITILLFLIFITLLGGFGYYIYNEQQTVPPKTTSDGVVDRYIDSLYLLPYYGWNTVYPYYNRSWGWWGGRKHRGGVHRDRHH